MNPEKSALANQVATQVYNDIEYINNFISQAPKARIASNYREARMIKSITSSIYPQIFGFLVRNYSRAEAIKRLKVMGQKAVRIYYAINKNELHQKSNLQEIFKGICRDSGERIRITDIVKKKVGKKKIIQSLVIKKYRCIFCTETTLMENIDVPYCLPSVGYWEQWYNIRSLYQGNWQPRLIHMDVTKTAEHDKDFCEYHVEVLE
ncbi:MAG: hypothetical protein ACTSQI_13600 [Candidatus Helarchaeota archaeon]